MAKYSVFQTQKTVSDQHRQLSKLCLMGIYMPSKLYPMLLTLCFDADTKIQQIPMQ